MKFFGCYNVICLLSALLFFTISSGAVLERREGGGGGVVCQSSEQKCTPTDGPSYCCPKENMKCGPVKGQCVKISTSEASKPATTVEKSSVATPIAATPEAQSIATDSQAVTYTTPSATEPSSTAAASSSDTGALSAVKNFFKPNVIIIFAVSGGGALLAITLISCFCYRKRKQGRLLLAAYENPNRDAYKSIIITGSKPAPPPDATKGATDTTKEVENPLPLPPPSAMPAPQVQSERSPQPQYFDLYSPESPAFQMTAQTPAGPLEHSSGGGGDGSNGYYFTPEQQQQQQQQQQYQYQYQQPEQQQQQQQQQQQTYYPEMRHHDVNNGYGGAIENHYGSSPGESYAAGDIYSAYAAPHPPEEIYTHPVQEYPPRQYIPAEPAPSSWSPQHYRQLTPSHQIHPIQQQESPPRPPRGPDVYLPAALRDHNGMPHAI